MSRRDVRQQAMLLRARLEWEDPYFKIVDVLEFVFPIMMPGFEFQVRTRRRLGDNHGLTFPDRQIIQLREDVYEAAVRGDGFARLTAAHEIGHLLLHNDVPLARRVRKGSIPAYRCSEWQANAYGGELLVDASSVSHCRDSNGRPDVEAVMNAYGVSRSAAETQIRVFQQDRIL